MYSIDTGTDELLCHIYERVATITLNKPQKKCLGRYFDARFEGNYCCIRK